MNRIILGLMLLLSPTLSNAEFSTLQRLLLINDAYTWSSDGKSLINWEKYYNKSNKVNKGILSPVQIYYEFRRNIFNAEDSFTNSMQIVRAPFQSIERNSKGEPVIILDVDYVHHIYLTGLTVREARDLTVSRPVELLCTNFKLDKMKDMSAMCSMIINKDKFVGLIIGKNIAEFNIKKSLPIDVFNAFQNIEKLFSKDSLDYINEICKVVDSTNIDLCLDQLEYGLEIKKD